MAKFQFENPNYTMTPNDLFDHLLKQIDDVSELKVTLAAVRMTIGYHEKEAELSIEYLHQMTGLARNSVRRGLALALRRGSIRIVKKSTNRTGGIYALNVGHSAADSLEVQPVTPLKKTLKKENNKKAEPPKVNAYASYNAAFGEPIPNPTSPRTINAVEDLEEFPQDWLDEAFLRTSKRERSAGERWKDYQRFPYALSILNEWKHAGKIVPEQTKPTYPQRAKPGIARAPAPKPKQELPSEAEIIAYREMIAKRNAALPPIGAVT